MSTIAKRAQMLPPPLPAKQFMAGFVKTLLAEKKLLLIIAIAILAVVLFFTTIGLVLKAFSSTKSSSSHQATSGSIVGSKGFQMTYRAIDDGNSGKLEVTVKGKATKLAVIFTKPGGENVINIIEADRMITNCAITGFPTSWLEPGTYTLALKTFDPEDVVCKEEIVWSPAKLTVEDVKFEKYQSSYIGAHITLKIFLHKEGTLPIDIFYPISATVNGIYRADSLNSFDGSHTVIDQHKVVTVRIYFDDSNHKSGNRYLVKGRLLYGKDRQGVDFEKEFVVR